MRVSNAIFSGIIALAIVVQASADIYESKDAQGNTVFSDKPSPGAQEIELPPTNSADPVAETPRPPAQQDAPARQRAPTSGERVDESDHVDSNNGDTIYYDGDYARDELYQRRALERRDGDDDAQPKRERPARPVHQRSAPRKAGGGAGRR